MSDRRRASGRAVLLAAFLLAEAFAKAPVYEVVAIVETDAPVHASIFGATTPFSESTISDSQGRFRFRKLLAGAYTIAVLAPGRGEARVTIDVGPGSADSKGRVVVRLNLKDSDFTAGDAARQRHAVSVRQLSIPDRAWREYEDARKDLARRDAAAAVSHLEKAVDAAPQFAVAWNTLGTIAYQTQKYERAEQCFREALAHDANSYEALVNLGGVLINVEKLGEARDYNERAVSIRPGDALANSQLGMTYFYLGDLERAARYLAKAVEIDPGHFSHPQLLLAEIHRRQGQPQLAADDLEGFLLHHPDWPKAMKMRATIVSLRGEKK